MRSVTEGHQNGHGFFKNAQFYKTLWTFNTPAIFKLLETIYDVLWTFKHIKTDKIMFGSLKTIKNIDCDSVTEGRLRKDNWNTKYNVCTE